MLLEGQKINRYHLLRLLGSGGMGDVYLAEDARIGQQVAIKILRTEIISSSDEQFTSDSTRLFEREARAIVKLDHPHILPLFDYGEQRLGETTVLYLVMPYRPEGSLSRWINKHKRANPLSLQQITHLLGQAADALQHAHNRQIIHQDIKPSNFLIRENEGDPSSPDLLLTDFGIARLTTMTSSMSQSVRGTPTYMAPEQYGGHSLPASDQYALAIMAYELFTGSTPFQGGAMQVMYQHLHDRPQPPSTRNPLLSPEIDAVVLRALEKQPDARFASTTAFANALQQAVQRLPENRGSAIVPPQGISPLPTPPIDHQNELRAQLAIDREEARKGTSRTITLPGGKRVRVSVPAGVEDGYELRLNQQGSITPDGSSIGTIILNIVIKQETKNSPVPNPISEDRTYLTPSKGLLKEAEGNIEIIDPAHVVSSYESPPIIYSTYQDAHIDGQVFSAHSIPPTMPVTPPPPPRMSSSSPILEIGGQNASSSHKASRLKRGYFIGLALLIIIASIMGISAYSNSRYQEAQATATAQAQTTATAQAQAQATAVVVSANPYPAYLPGSGELTLYDSLRSPGYWINYEDKSFGGSCQFANSALHIHQSKANKFYQCLAYSPTDSSALSFSNFAFEVQMTITGGDCGGMTLREDPNNGKFYKFEVCQDKTYTSYKYIDYSGTHASLLTTPNANSAALKAGVNQTNTIAVVAQGNTMLLFINNQQIASIQDGSYAKGDVGLIASASNNDTDVNYSNARIWTL